jgi:C_GCAxxG_C_C family probable redox protein
LDQREWNLPEIEDRFRRLVKQGIPEKTLDREALAAEKEALLDRVQRRAEEYCYLMRNCAKSTATALMEEFGFGSLEIIKAMGPVPGLAMSGGPCGPVTGGMVALGYFFADADMTNHNATTAYLYGGEFVRRFESVFGSLHCPDIQRRLLGQYYDPMSSAENLKAFYGSAARENCPLAPGMGARIAAELILKSLKV